MAQAQYFQAHKKWILAIEIVEQQANFTVLLFRFMVQLFYLKISWVAGRILF
jgi:hypothetical protein